MSGKKGMHHTKPEQSLRRNIWRSMRIMRTFTIPALMRTTGATEHNVRSFLIRLDRHGIVARNGLNHRGRSGDFQQFRLVKDVGPEYPTVCPVCGRSLSNKCEILPENTQTETDTQAQPAGGPP